MAYGAERSELRGDLFNSSICASFVSARAVCVANADRTDGFVANLNRHAAANSDYPGESGAESTREFLRPSHSYDKFIRVRTLTIGRKLNTVKSTIEANFPFCLRVRALAQVVCYLLSAIFFMRARSYRLDFWQLAKAEQGIFF